MAVLPGGDLALVGGFHFVGGKVSVNYVTLGCPMVCYADCNGSGSLDIDDFVCFSTRYALWEATADCDGSGSLDIDDFMCFQTAFAVGC